MPFMHSEKLSDHQFCLPFLKNIQIKKPMIQHKDIKKL